MAGDWIKMRPSLLTHPRVVAMASRLAASRIFIDWWTTGTHVTPKENVTEIVTVDAVTRVTVSGLLSVWGAANEHTDDGFFRGIEIPDLDSIAGIWGFGEAMETVGWAVPQDDPPGVRLSNFLEYNTPGRSRGIAKTDSERSKRYRDTKKSRHEIVTKSSRDESQNVTPEKRREEKMMIPPIPPSGAAGGEQAPPEKTEDQETQEGVSQSPTFSPTPPPDTLVSKWGFSPREAKALRADPGITQEDEAAWEGRLKALRDAGKARSPVAYVKTLMRSHRRPEDAEGELGEEHEPEADDSRRQELAAAIARRRIPGGAEFKDSRGRAWSMGRGGGVYGPGEECGFRLLGFLDVEDLEAIEEGLKGGET